MSEPFPVGGALRPPAVVATEAATPVAPSAPVQQQQQRRRPTMRVGAVVALALAAGFVAWLVLRDRGSSPPKAAATAAAPASEASVAQLAALARSLGHPIFWIGPKVGSTYELTQTESGKVYVRYLPKGVEVGADKPYLTVGTYPFPGAFAALQKQSESEGAVAVKLPQGGVAVLDNAHPKSTYVAYPGIDYQVEVFDPTPGAAMQTVTAGRLAAFGGLHSTEPVAGSKPVAVSETALRSLAASLGHPIYWAGPKRDYTYELTRTSNGNVFLRYLPAGVKAGAKASYLTVATYPFPNALAAIQLQAKGNRADTIELPGGGVALIDHADPKSIHLAYPHSDYQVEVFDPAPARARRTVASGRIAAVS